MFAQHTARFRYLDFVRRQPSIAHQAQWMRKHSGQRIFQPNSQSIANLIRGLTPPGKLEYPRRGHKDPDRGHRSASPLKLLMQPESNSALYLRWRLPSELRGLEEPSSLPSIPPLLLKVPSCRSTSI